MQKNYIQIMVKNTIIKNKDNKETNVVEIFYALTAMADFTDFTVNLRI